MVFIVPFIKYWTTDSNILSRPLLHEKGYIRERAQCRYFIKDFFCYTQNFYTSPAYWNPLYTFSYITLISSSEIPKQI